MQTRFTITPELKARAEHLLAKRKEESEATLRDFKATYQPGTDPALDAEHNRLIEKRDHWLTMSLENACALVNLNDSAR